MENKIYLIICLFTITCSFSQNEIEGKIVFSDLIGAPGVGIHSPDNKVVGTTDENGNFKIDNSSNFSYLRFSFTGMRNEIVELNVDCKYIQAIMFENIKYCFMSEKKNIRLRKRDLNERKKAIPKLLVKAVDEKIFEANKMCNKQKINL